MRKVGDMRVGPSAKTIHEEKIKKIAIANYRASFEEAYARATQGIIEWLGDKEMPDEQKNHDEEGNALVYVLSVKKSTEPDGHNFHTMSISYDRKPIFEINCTMQEMNFFLEGEKYLTRIFELKEKDIVESLKAVKYDQSSESKTVENVVEELNKE